MIEIVRAVPEHILSLEPRVRTADVLEMMDGYGLSPARAMVYGLAVSSRAWTGLHNGVPVAIAGVHCPSMLSDTANPWMLGSYDLETRGVKRDFLKVSRHILAEMLRLYGHLENYVDARNTKAIAWLKWLGFEMHEPAPYGVMQLPFHHFEIRRP